MKSTQKRIVLTIGFAAIGSAALQLCAQNIPNLGGFQDTPIIPGLQWHVHDNLRPQPEVITPGTFSTPDAPGKPPSDAVVLFDGTNLDKWQKDNGQAASWKVENGYAQVQGGGIRTKDEFGDCQLHLEWSAPTPPRGNSQGRGNSGVFMMGRYEIQILDNFDNPTYADGTAGAIYGQTPPQVNPLRPPGEWNVYDIIWTGPRFKDGKLEKPAYVTLLINGVVVQNHTMLIGNTPFKNVGKYSPHGETGPISLQDHGNPMRFRNIWIRPLRPVEVPTLATP
jgi:hypothetical protein